MGGSGAAKTEKGLKGLAVRERYYEQQGRQEETQSESLNGRRM